MYICTHSILWHNFTPSTLCKLQQKIQEAVKGVINHHVKIITISLLPVTQNFHQLQREISCSHTCVFTFLCTCKYIHRFRKLNKQ